MRIADRDKRSAWDVVEVAHWEQIPAAVKSDAVKSDAVKSDAVKSDAVQPGAVRLLAADLDNNGAPDLIVSGPEASRVWLGDQAGGKFTASGPICPASSSRPSISTARGGSISSVWTAMGGRCVRQPRHEGLSLADDSPLGSGTEWRQPDQFVRLGWRSGSPERHVLSEAADRRSGRPFRPGESGGRGSDSHRLAQWHVAGRIQPAGRHDAGSASSGSRARARSCSPGTANGSRSSPISCGARRWGCSSTPSDNGPHLSNHRMGSRSAAINLSPGDGYYDLRINANLWETHFFDHLSLVVVDHSAGTEIFVDERFSPASTGPKMYLTENAAPDRAGLRPLGPRRHRIGSPRSTEVSRRFRPRRLPRTCRGALGRDRIAGRRGDGSDVTGRCICWPPAGFIRPTARSISLSPRAAASRRTGSCWKSPTAQAAGKRRKTSVSPPARTRRWSFA